MNKKVKVLVFPCGSQIASEIHQALRYSLHVELFGSSSIDDYGRFRYERYFGDLPNIKEPQFDEAFSRLVAELGIDVVFATHDTVHDYLAPRAQAMGFTLINGDPETAAIVRRKSATYALFKDKDWMPRVYSSVEDVTDWPIIVKPDLGQGGQGVTLVHGALQAREAVQRTELPVIVEYLPGDELTVDCFTDRERRLIWVGPRTRERVKAGITMRSRLMESTPEITKIASEINERLRLRGAWFFQVKSDKNGQWKLLEVASRISSTTGAQRARGVNLPLMAVQDYMGRDLVALVNPQIKLAERNIATRAELDFDYDSVFVDLDETLIMNGCVIPITMAFLYQVKASGKKIILITKHRYDVAETLAKVHIAASLFDNIIVLGDGESKADYITSKSIFIDNYFSERLDVARRLAIPVLDVDMVEFFVK